MCDPVTIAAASFAASAASAGINYIGQSQQAAAQEAVEMQRFEETERFRRQNALNAIGAYNENVAQLQNRQRQEDIARVEEKERIDRETRQAAGTAMASATNPGVSLSLILGEYARRAGDAVNTLETQAKFDNQQTRQQIEGARAQALDVINSARPYIPTPVVQPQPLGLAVNIASAGVSSLSAFNQLRYYQRQGSS